jgi:hypothetical protein
MDNKELVEKVLKGEDIAELTKDFTAEQKTALNIDISKAADQLAQDNLGKAKATTEELNRRKKALEDGDTKSKETMTQFREEQVEKARAKLFSNPRFVLTDVERLAFDEAFKRLDTGKVDSDLILVDLKKAYVATKPDSFIAAEDEVQNLKKGAASFNSKEAGASGGSLSKEDEEKYSPKAKELYKQWQRMGFTGVSHSLDAAQKVTEQGMRRKLG